jgi:hypothetical protein
VIDMEHPAAMPRHHWGEAAAVSRLQRRHVCIDGSLPAPFDEGGPLSAYYMRQTDRGRVRQRVWPGGFFV